MSALGHIVHVASARKVRSIPQSDRPDAWMLVQFGRVDPPLLNPSQHRLWRGSFFPIDCLGRFLAGPFIRVLRGRLWRVCRIAIMGVPDGGPLAE
jgi:hypothetical protein